eukprot:1157658-Pelagomonas_calceolata.AAC.6
MVMCAKARLLRFCTVTPHEERLVCPLSTAPGAAAGHTMAAGHTNSCGCRCRPQEQLQLQMAVKGAS